jgi:hypothetical protein
MLQAVQHKRPVSREKEMSDFSGLEQSFALPAMPVLPPFDDIGDEPPVTTDVQPHEVNFRQLRGSREISQVLHLRAQIQLPASALTDSGFALREKKETRWAWSARSCASGRP